MRSRKVPTSLVLLNLSDLESYTKHFYHILQVDLASRHSRTMAVHKDMKFDEQDNVTAFVSQEHPVDASGQDTPDDVVPVSPGNERQSTQTQLTGRAIHGFKWFLVIVAIFSTNFLFALDNTIVADIQPAIIQDLGEINKLSWISVGFSLGAASTNFLWGRIYSQFEIKRLYITSVLIFQIGSALCGAAQTMNMLIGGRILAGLGCQGMYIGVMTLIGSITTLQERPLYISFGGIVWGVGTVLGPVIGAAFTSSPARWRWSFYINLCIGALFAPIYFCLLPSIHLTTGIKISRRLHNLDFVGAILVLAATPLGILAIDFGGTVYAWSSGTIITFFVLSGTLLLLLGV